MARALRKLDLSGGPDYAKEMKRLDKRLRKLRAAQSGAAEVSQTWVKQSCWVKRHRRQGHWRTNIKLLA